MVVISAGIRPRDELARASGLAVGERGGIVVDPRLATSDPDVFAIGECALANGTIYGLVGPGYAMADALAERLCGGEATFTGADLSTKLKLLGIDVATFGDAFADETAGSHAQRLVIEDRVRGVYQKLVLNADGTPLARRGPGRRRDAVYRAAGRLPARHTRAGTPARVAAGRERRQWSRRHRRARR